MAKTKVQRKGRRGMPAVRRRGTRPRSVTLGELIAATMDVVDGDARRAAKVLGSRAMAGSVDRKIVVY